MVAVLQGKTDEWFAEYTRDNMISHLSLLEDHLLNWSVKPEQQCLDCAYWHIVKLRGYAGLECVKFTEGKEKQVCYNLIPFLDRVEKALPRLTKQSSLALAKEIREWRYRLAQFANMSTVEMILADLKSNHQRVREIHAQIDALHESLLGESARRLIKYIKRSGRYKGEIVDFTPKQYREITGRFPRNAIINPKTRKIPWELALDDLATELGYPTDEALKNAIERCLEVQKQIDGLKHDLAIARKEAKAPTACSTLSKTETACIDPMHGDWCKGKVIECDGIEATAVRHPSTWGIHMVKEGDLPSIVNQAGEVRFASEAAKMLKEIAKGMEGKRKLRDADLVTLLNEMAGGAEMKESSELGQILEGIMGTDKKTFWKRINEQRDMIKTMGVRQPKTDRDYGTYRQGKADAYLDAMELYAYYHTEEAGVLPLTSSTVSDLLSQL